MVIPILSEMKKNNNQELSLARANEVRSIIENALSKAGRTDVKFEVYGFGVGSGFSTVWKQISGRTIL